MKRKRTLVPALLITLLLGLATSVAAVSPHAAVSAIRDAHPKTTDVTSTTTGDATTGDATTTTAASTTDMTPTTTVDSQSGGNSSTTGQGSQQGNVDAPATTTQPATTTTSSPPISCSNGQLDCGNNAATQIAVVSQTCQNTAQDTVNITVQAVDGTPQGNYTINPQTCINVAQITQVVQQFCINCTIVIVPTPAAAAAAAPAARSAPPRAFYCAPSPVLRDDGTWGTFLDLEKGQPSVDPRFADATPAPFDLAHGGYYCPSGGPATLQGAPVFTLTVPASFVGQVLQLCIQPADPAQKPVCHDVRIDQGATISVPVTSNVAASVHLANGKQKTVTPKASAAALAAASKRLSHASAKPRACTKSKVKPHKKCTQK
jgi:hypothetical protein